MNCKNCGAPINLSLGKCEYCDTEYDDIKYHNLLIQLHDQTIRDLRKKELELQNTIQSNYILSKLNRFVKYTGE